MSLPLESLSKALFLPLAPSAFLLYGLFALVHPYFLFLYLFLSLFLAFSLDLPPIHLNLRKGSSTLAIL